MKKTLFYCLGLMACGSMVLAQDVTLPVIQDSYVRNGANAGNTYGATDAANLEVKSVATPTGFTRRALFAFNIKDIDTTISTAIFEVSGRVEDNTASNIKVEVFASSGAFWNENTVTWNSRPVADTVPLSSTILPGSVKTRLMFDVSSYINNAIKMGKDTLTIVLAAKDETTPRLFFDSKETVGGAPAQLKLTYGGELVYPSADAFVRGGTFTAVNYGADTTIILKNAAGDFSRKGMISFNLKPYTTPLYSVNFNFLHEILGGNNTDTTKIIVRYSNTAFNESTVTNSTLPAFNVLDTLTGDLMTTRSKTKASIDVTSIVNTGIENGDSVITFLFDVIATITPLVTVNTKEYASASSYLSIQRSAPTSLAGSVTSGIQVYPNPSAGEIKVKTDSPLSYSLYSLQGASLSSGTLEAGITPLYISAQGVYLLVTPAKTFKLVVE